MNPSPEDRQPDLERPLIESLLARKTESRDVTAGQIITVDVDRVMIHDLFVPFCIRKFEEMGFRQVWDPEKVVLVYDHMVPTSFIDDSRHHRLGDRFAAEQGIRRVHRADGVCHQLMPERGYALPGQVVFGTDSHTTTYGAIGAFSTGIGYTEMASVLGTGRLWVKVPHTLRFDIRGEMPDGVCSKDLILRIIGDIGADGASYRAMEFGGPAVQQMSISMRMTMCNMAVEAGAKAGLIEPDDKTFAFCRVDAEDYGFLKAGPGAVYEKRIEYDVSRLSPTVALPSKVDNVESVEKVAGMRIDQAFLGSCTNGRTEDLEAAADIVRGRKIAPRVRFIVTPASRRVLREAVKKGVISTLMDAGAVVTYPSCGLCCGRSGGILASGERVIAANNRNFLGRMGASDSEVVLASPATVAASALAGKIADPRDYL